MEQKYGKVDYQALKYNYKSSGGNTRDALKYEDYIQGLFYSEEKPHICWEEFDT